MIMCDQRLSKVRFIVESAIVASQVSSGTSKIEGVCWRLGHRVGHYETTISLFLLCFLNLYIIAILPLKLSIRLLLFVILGMLSL